MGLQEHDRVPVYLGCFNGKLVRKLKSPTEKSVTRINKKGDTIHELQYDSITGLMIGLSTRDSDYGRQLVIVLYDEDTEDEFRIQVPLSSGYSYGIFKRIPNIDFSKVLKLKPYFIADPKSDKAGFTVLQDDKKIENFYTKEAPNGMPEWEQKEIKGKMTWDDSAALKFFVSLIISDVLPVLKINAATASFGNMEAPAEDIKTSADTSDPFDDIKKDQAAAAAVPSAKELALKKQEDKEKAESKAAANLPDDSGFPNPDEIDGLPF